MSATVSSGSIELDQRLLGCFQAVFPKEAPESLQSASAATLEAWDSVAAITLVTVVGQEFGIEIDLDDLGELQSFDAFRQYLSSH